MFELRLSPYTLVDELAKRRHYFVVSALLVFVQQDLITLSIIWARFISADDAYSKEEIE